MFKFSLFILAQLLLGCASSPDTSTTFSMSENQYEKTTEDYSAHVQKYDGPYNVLEVHATLINSHVSEAQLLRQATLFRWDKSKYQSELELKQKNANEKTEVFVSFFTPDKKTSNLARTDTLWKVVLKVEGKEFVGAPKKLSLLPIEIKNLYPHYNQWSYPYVITFEIPVNQIEHFNTELIFTGPVGTALLKFPAIKKTPVESNK